MKALFEFETFLLPEILNIVFGRAQVLQWLPDFVRLAEVVTAKLLRFARIARVPSTPMGQCHDILLIIFTAQDLQQNARFIDDVIDRDAKYGLFSAQMQVNGLLACFFAIGLFKRAQVVMKTGQSSNKIFHLVRKVLQFLFE